MCLHVRRKPESSRIKHNIYRRSKVSPAVVFVVLKIFENSSGDDWVV